DAVLYLRAALRGRSGRLPRGEHLLHRERRPRDHLRALLIPDRDHPRTDPPGLRGELARPFARSVPPRAVRHGAGRERVPRVTGGGADSVRRGPLRHRLAVLPLRGAPAHPGGPGDLAELAAAGGGARRDLWSLPGAGSAHLSVRAAPTRVGAGVLVLGTPAIDG